MKAIRNMQELNLMKQKLRYQELLHKKEISDTSAKIADNINRKIQGLTFDMGLYLFRHFIFNAGKSKNQKD